MKEVYLTKMGSHAYKTNQIQSDVDYYSIFIPNVIFPEQERAVPGFGRWNKIPLEKNVQTQVGINDYNRYNIVSFFQLVPSSPNLMESLYTSDDCVVFDSIGIRSFRHLFLSKKVYYSFKGMAKNLKHTYHCIRLLDVGAQLLLEHNADLTRLSSELVDIRHGKPYENLFAALSEKLDLAFEQTTLPLEPNMDELQQLLWNITREQLCLSKT